MNSPFIISLEKLPDQDSIERARDDAQEKLSESGSRLARMKWPMLRDAAANGMHDKLSELDPLTMLAGAWGTALELRELAARTRAPPGSKEAYPLGKHDLSASVHPVVTLRCGPLIFPGLTFTVTIHGRIECAILIIANGRLHSIEALSLTPSAALSYGSRELNRIDGNAITLGEPFVLPNGGLEIPFN